tara:strand:+ start:227 stop:346 length:120 start_codon:yes stop_codon:yes gene_type:complete
MWYSGIPQRDTHQNQIAIDLEQKVDYSFIDRKLTPERQL